MKASVGFDVDIGCRVSLFVVDVAAAAAVLALKVYERIFGDFFVTEQSV